MMMRMMMTKMRMKMSRMRMMRMSMMKMKMRMRMTMRMRMALQRGVSWAPSPLGSVQFRWQEDSMWRCLLSVKEGLVSWMGAVAKVFCCVCVALLEVLGGPVGVR